MELVHHDALTFGQFKILSGLPRLLHAVTTRHGGSSGTPFAGLNLGMGTGDDEQALLANYARLSRALDLDLQTVVSSHQVHGDAVAIVDEPPVHARPYPLSHALAGFDGFVTDRIGIALMVRVADCVPLILYDPVRHALAVVHAGWRGTAAGIAEKAARIMAERYGCNPGDMLAGIGPCIGPCCYEVGSEVADRFRHAMPDSTRILMQEGPGSYALDLSAANALQLQQAGLAPAHIEQAYLCTACNLHLFFSHRGEQGKAGRFALVAGLRA